MASKRGGKKGKKKARKGKRKRKLAAWHLKALQAGRRKWYNKKYGKKKKKNKSKRSKVKYKSTKAGRRAMANLAQMFGGLTQAHRWKARHQRKHKNKKNQKRQSAPVYRAARGVGPGAAWA